ATTGFIGLGQMGYRMAGNLFRSRPAPFVIFDVDDRATARFVTEHGAAQPDRDLRIARTPAEVAEQADVIITMLPASAHVRDVYLGDPAGLLTASRPGTLFIDSSTIDPSVARELAAAVAFRSAALVDAPVSGGVMGAQAGTLTFMAGAPNTAAVDQVRPILDTMGKHVVYCGPNGNGQVAKICNNMLLGICMIGTAEAMNLGQKLGMDPVLLASILNTSTGRCWASEVSNPCPGAVPDAPASRDYEGGFGVSLMAKDMGLAMTAANQSRAVTNLGALAHQIYSLVANTPGLQKKDFGVVYKWLQGKSS
ncbi:hypothetical protein IWQ60_008391, partial [Tieghemiomyces parasiticus]